MRNTLLPLLLLAGCRSSVVVGDLEEVTTLRAIHNPNLDILFVVDNSASMAEQQASLAANFPRMIDVLSQLDGGLPNLHIGVVTSDVGTSTVTGEIGPPIGVVGQGGCAGVGDNGVLRTTPALTGSFIADIAQSDGTRVTNYTGELRDVFGELARVGAAGCGFEQYLSAMTRALDNPDFLRPNANLAVVIVADEDDCSALDPALFGADSLELGRLGSFRCTQFGIQCSPDDLTTPGAKSDCRPRTIAPLVSEVQPFVDALVDAKAGDPRTVLVAAITGPPTPVDVVYQQLGGTPQLALSPSCTFAGPAGPELADPAVRIAAFLDAFPGRSRLTSICDADLSSALTDIGASAKKLVGDPCLDANLADSSPDPGTQPACEVFEIRDSAPSITTVVPACSGGDGYCFDITPDPTHCPTAPGNLRLSMRRIEGAALDTWTHVRCQLADD